MALYLPGLPSKSTPSSLALGFILDFLMGKGGFWV
jgi:hypothetical protein